MFLRHQNNSTITCEQSTCPGYKFRAPVSQRPRGGQVNTSNLLEAYGLCVEDSVQTKFGDCTAVIDWLQYRWFTAIELACQ